MKTTFVVCLGVVLLVAFFATLAWIVGGMQEDSSRVDSGKNHYRSDSTEALQMLDRGTGYGMFNGAFGL